MPRPSNARGSRSRPESWHVPWVSPSLVVWATIVLVFAGALIAIWTWALLHTVSATFVGRLYTFVLAGALTVLVGIVFFGLSRMLVEHT